MRLPRLFLPAVHISKQDEKNYRINSDHQQALLLWISHSCDIGDLDMLRILVNPSTVIHELPKDFHDACKMYFFDTLRKGRLEIVKYIVQIGFTSWVTPDALFHAEAESHEETVQLLAPIVNLPP